MAHGQFIVSDVNPNDNMGGGGCICSPRKQIDCKPPYCIFSGNDMESHLSPHVVVCESCVRLMAARLGTGEVLSAGERNTIPGHAEPQAREQAESPEVDFDNEPPVRSRRKREETSSI